MTKAKEIHAIDQLCEMLAELRTPGEIRMLLRDLCTTQEIEKMAARLEAARLLLLGETYQSIVAKTEISSATLSRVSRCVQEGSGGYNTLLAKRTTQGEDTL